jgi:hypothetical protein
LVYARAGGDLNPAGPLHSHLGRHNFNFWP